MRRFRNIVAALMVLLALGSCQGPRKIPRSRMGDIYYDMFLLDQKIRQDGALRRHADTMLVYESVFRKYGYNTDDYLFSVGKYLEDPERFSKILGEVSDRLNADAARVEHEITLESWRNGMMKLYGMPADTTAPRQRDTLWADTLRIGKDQSRILFFQYRKAPKDSLGLLLDTLSVPLSVQKDTLS